MSAEPMFEIVGESGERGEGCLSEIAVATLASLLGIAGAFFMFKVFPEVLLWLA